MPQNVLKSFAIFSYIIEKKTPVIYGPRVG